VNRTFKHLNDNLSPPCDMYRCSSTMIVSHMGREFLFGLNESASRKSDILYAVVMPLEVS